MEGSLRTRVLESEARSNVNLRGFGRHYSVKTRVVFLLGIRNRLPRGDSLVCNVVAGIGEGDGEDDGDRGLLRRGHIDPYIDIACMLLGTCTIADYSVEAK